MPAASIRPSHPVPRSLSELCAHFGLDAPEGVDQVEVTGVSISSLDVEAGDLYVGLPGARVHGASYAANAAEAGAAFIADLTG